MLLLQTDFHWTLGLTFAMIVGAGIAVIVTIYLFSTSGTSTPAESPHFYDFDRPDGSANVTPIDLDKIEEYRNDFPDAS